MLKHPIVLVNQAAKERSKRQAEERSRESRMAEERFNRSATKQLRGWPELRHTASGLYVS